LTRRHAASEITLSTSWLFWGLIFGSIGFGFFIYGKKQKAIVPMVCGIILLIFPYFISNTLLLVTIGVALMAIPFFVKI